MTFINLLQILSHLIKYSSPIGISDYLKKLIDEHKEILESEEYISLINGFLDICLNRHIIVDIPIWFLKYRTIRASKLYYPSSVEIRILVLGNEDNYRENYLSKALPEFLKYNIVLTSIEGAI